MAKLTTVKTEVVSTKNVVLQQYDIYIETKNDSYKLEDVCLEDLEEAGLLIAKFVKREKGGE